MDDRQAATAAAQAVGQTYLDLGMPLRLRDVGMPEKEIRVIAEDSMTDFGLHRNVRPVKGMDELVRLLREIW
jgi:alcohol dehydrogenase class IV